MMAEKEFDRSCGKILAGMPLSDEEANNFMDVIDQMINMLNEGDQDDVFGTEGWRHIMGWN